ncbi:Rv1733c family protein [Streptomyces sp. NPDC054783]
MTRKPPTAAGRVRLWRWRRNPLRRRSDLVEGWVVLAAWLLVLVGGGLAGVVAAQVTDSAFAARAARAHAVSAVLTDDAPKTPVTAGGYDDGRVSAAVRWTDPDGSVHTGRTQIYPGAPAGTPVAVWADRAGHLVSAPVTGEAATVQAALTGALVAVPAGAAVWTVGWVVRSRLVRRRMAEWDEEWKQIGPEWGNLSGGRG